MLYTSGMALAMPSLTLMVLDLFPQNRGLASSLQQFTHSFLMALTAGFVSPWLSGLALTLALGMAGLLALGWCAWTIYLRVAARG
jgi:DHA1 family bicyclomycin/chloramphenicol resistance-like MFS transporter